MDSTFFLVLAILAITIQTFLLFLALSEPVPRYRVSGPRPVESDQGKFLRTLEALADAPVREETWCVAGSTNFAPRSFGLNDEVNLAAHDRGLAARIGEDFRGDMVFGTPVRLCAWRNRPITESLERRQ